MTIGKSLIFKFAALSLVVSLAAVFAVIRIGSGVQNAGEFHGPSLQQIQIIEARTNGAIQESYAYLVSGDAREKEKFLAWAKGFDAEADKFSQIARLDGSEEKQEKILFEKILSLQRRLKEETANLFQEYETKGSVAPGVYSAYEGSLDALVSAIEILVKHEKQEAHEAYQSAFRVISDAKSALYVLALLAVGFSIFWGFVTARGLTTRIGILGNAAEKIGKGEFDIRVDLEQTDEIGILGNSVNAMASQLQEKFAKEQQVAKVNQLNLELKYETLERKQAEETLRRSEEKYEDLYENAPDMFVSVDAKTGNIRECNKTLSLITGFSKAEIIGNPVSNLYSPEDRPKVLQALEQFRRTGETHAFDIQLLQKDGGKRDVVLNASAMRDMEGRILFSRSVLRDVTQQKKALVALEESEQRFRELAENLNDVVWVLSVDSGKVIYVNSAFERIWGDSRDKLYQDASFWIEAVHPEDRERTEAAFRAMLVSGTFDEEYRIVRGDGSVRWIHDRGTCLTNQQGEPYRIIGIAGDITERKNAAELLRASEERNRLALEAGAMGTFDYDIRRNVNYWSPELEHIFGLQSGTFEQTYEAFISRIYPEDQEKVSQSIEKAVASMGNCDFEFRIVTPQNLSETWVAGCGQVIPDEQGNPARILGVAYDATVKKLAQQKVEENERRFRRLVDHAPFGIHEISLDGLIVSMNTAGLEMLYLREEREVLGKHYLDFMGERDKDRIESLLNLACDGQSSVFEFWVDDERCFQSSFVPIENPAGTVERLMGITQDITERKKTEHTFQNLIQGTSSSIGGEFFNGFIEKISLALGVRFALVTELMNEPLSQLRSLACWHKQLVPETMQYPISGTPCEVVLREGSAYFPKGVQELFPDDGDLKIVDGESYLGISLRGSTGETIGHLCVVHDQPLADPSRAQSILTIFGARASAELERLHAEQEKARTLEAVYEREERLALALDATSEGVWDWDITTGQVVVSKHWMESLGYPTDVLEFPVSHWENLLHPDDRSRVLDTLTAHMDGLTPVYQCENRLLTKSGEWRWNLDRGKVVRRDKNGRPLRMVGTDTDISERKLAENELKQSYDQLQKMTAQLEAAQENERKRIAQELHDEFGQSLTGLNFDLSWIIKKLVREGNAIQTQAYLAKLRSMSSTVVSIIQSIRKIASSLRPSILDDLGLIEALEEELREFQERTGIISHLDISPELQSQHIPELVATALYRISQEFLTNVMKHAQASQVHVCLKKTDEGLILELKDNGKGVSNSQINGSPTWGIVGMKERTMSLGGDFSISGNPGKGTTATVRIPISIHANHARELQP